MSKIGIGVLSYAHGHVNVYSAQIKGFEDAELVSVWDDNLERGKANAEAFGAAFKPHLEDVLDDPAIELVIIASETNKHADLVVAACAAGKNVILQKPMALNLADCDRIIEAVERNGVWFSLAFQMRYDPANIRMKELIDGGYVGRVGVLRRRHCISVLFNENFVKGPTKWHIDPEANMGMWMDDASHAADFLYWMLGEPVSVVAEIDNVLTTVAPDDTGVAIYRFRHGEIGILFNSSVTWAGENTTEIYGDRGVVIQNYGDGPALVVPPPPGAVALKYYDSQAPEKGWQDQGIPIPAGHGVRIQQVARHILDAYKAGRPTVTAREGKISTSMILGAYRAAREGRRVDLPLD
ncbi:MAG: Gfo/Idh/MocA family protein [Candidatus Zipacnadales bacterium]